MEDKKFGNVFESSLNRLFLENAEKNNMSYSHKKRDRWNLWEQDSNLILTFIAREKGVMIPCFVGMKKEALEKFHLSNLAQIDLWVKKDIKYYFEQLEQLYSPIEVSQEEVAYVRQLVQKKKEKKTKSKQVEGQLSFKDMGWK